VSHKDQDVHSGPSANVDPPAELIFYKTAQVAEIFSVKPATVTGWIRNGKMKAVALGGGARYRITQAEVRRFSQLEYGGNDDKRGDDDEQGD